MERAKSEVYKAVRSGRMVTPKWCSCADCGKPADCYDHRDYLKPLDVEPVCGSCNKRRGPGKNR